MKSTTVTRFLIAWAMAGALPAFAQNNIPGANGTNLTIVNIHATDTAASEAGHTGRFQVSRGERTNGDLVVWLQIGGTALNGIDYQALSNFVVIPNGARGAELTVIPVDDSLPESTESVVLRVVPSPVASPVIPYYVGSPNSATVTIADNDLNEPVIVGIVATDPYASEGLAMWCSNTVVGVNGQAANDGWRTNCPNVLGTNTASFTVRRTGPTNNSLRVYYSIGGTASNGVDYAPLSGLVTIAAGRRSAEIGVFPVDDTVPEQIETVLLKLRLPPLPLDPADSPYALGRPESAAAFIVDNDTPPPPPRVLPDGMFHACEHLSNGCFRVEISTNLLNWDIICTNAVADGMARHVDPDAANHLHRFYRITPIPCPPVEP